MLKRTKKTVAFLFKKMPADVFGFSQIKRNNVFLKQKWQDLSGPVCPHCAQAVMVLDTEREGVRRRSADGEDGETYTDLYHWVCPSEFCGADEMLPEKPAQAREWAKTIRNRIVAEQIPEMDEDQMSPYLKTHRITSRIMYGLSFLCLMFMAANILFWQDSLTRTLFIYTPVAAAFFSCGLKRSYRYWQLSNKRLFDETALRDFLSSGQWFI